MGLLILIYEEFCPSLWMRWNILLSGRTCVCVLRDTVEYSVVQFQLYDATEEK